MDVPIQVVVEDLDGCGLEAAGWLLRYGDQHGWVGFAEHEAFFALPFKLVSSWGGRSEDGISI